MTFSSEFSLTKTLEVQIKFLDMFLIGIAQSCEIGVWTCQNTLKFEIKMHSENGSTHQG